MWIPKAFPLAPMSGSIRVATAACLTIPVGLFVGSFWNVTMALPAVVVCVVFAVVWFWLRPTRFVVLHDALRVEWPLRTASTPMNDVLSLERLSGEDFRARYGRPRVRVGAGGLFGAFGMLVTPSETFDMYISNNDGLVLLRRRTAPPLLITPDEPDAFVASIEEARRTKPSLPANHG
jgi:hypothetical protein